jgi:hypothetical protein
MDEIHFFPEVVEARPKSSMCCFFIRSCFSISSHVGCALCVFDVVLAHAGVCSLSLLNVCGNSGYFCIFFLLSGYWHRGRPRVQCFNKCTNKTLTIGPFGNTCEADEVSPEVEAGGLQDSSVYNLAGTQICDHNT